MNQNSRTQRTINPTVRNILPQLYISTMVNQFLIAKETENKRHGTLRFYYQKLIVLEEFCECQMIKTIDQIDVPVIREFMAWLEANGHNPGGRHAFFRATKAFLNWAAEEIEDDLVDWKNPFLSKRLKAPKVDEQLLEPVNEDHIRALLSVCDDSFTGKRDLAIFYVLIDTGVRAMELASLQTEDIGWGDHSIMIRHTKNHHPRTGFFCRETKSALRAYLKLRDDDSPFLFITTTDFDQFTYDGLRAVVVRRAKQAGIPNPTIHAFRRTYAITMLRKGVNVFQLQRLMGHGDLQVLTRYVKQMKEDLRAAHDIGSPVEELLKRKTWRPKR